MPLPGSNDDRPAHRIDHVSPSAAEDGVASPVTNSMPPPPPQTSDRNGHVGNNLA